MATFAFNIAKGRTVELYNRVKSNDPAASAFVVIPLSIIGSEAQGQDFDTVAALLADANFEEQTAGGWARVTLTDAQLAAFPAPNDASNRYDVQVPEMSFGSPAAGNNVAGFLIAYDADTGTGTDANLLPLTAHDRVVNTDGNEVVVSAGNFLQAS